MVFCSLGEFSPYPEPPPLLPLSKMSLAHLFLQDSMDILDSMELSRDLLAP